MKKQKKKKKKRASFKFTMTITTSILKSKKVLFILKQPRENEGREVYWNNMYWSLGLQEMVTLGNQTLYKVFNLH